ncbi:MAG: hypothetical protein U9Q97_06605 [Acidobacteriota bacterium]|nr:hypothetical protein [Acidobacteriota bacterium]
MKFKEALDKAEISQTLFFKIGMICFIIIGFANLTDFILHFSIYSFFGVISKSAGIFFNFVLAGFFYTLNKNFGGNKSLDDYEALSEKKINEAIEKDKNDN